MESNMTTLGSSLKVPFVQELVEQKPSSVPPRYIRSDQTKVSGLSSNEIPVVDMQSLLHSENTENKELQKLHFACQEWGFFQLINHGVSSSLLERVKMEMQNFFHLPMEEKKKFEQEPGEIEGYGQAFVMSEQTKLDWADMLYMIILPNHMRNPHLFPNLPLPFREALEEYSTELKTLSTKILNEIAKALGMKNEEMRMLFDEGSQTMRMNYYPPCPQPELVVGLSTHSDASAITILLQVNEVEGLQIKRNGVWLPVVPLPNAFIVNVGDVVEMVTNGIYQSVEHRATVKSQSERLSIATFVLPKFEGDIIGPAPSLTHPESPAKYGTISTKDFLKKLFSYELDGRSLLESMRI